VVEGYSKIERNKVANELIREEIGNEPTSNVLNLICPLGKIQT